MESNELLSVSGLSKDFHSKRVLDDVTFAVAPGEIVALVGRNGTGKSTLGRIIAGTESESAGTISSLGVEYPRASRLEARARGVAMIEQRIDIDPTLTVAQAIFRGTFQQDRPHDALRRQAAWILNEMGMTLSPDELIGEVPRPLYGLIEAARVLTDDAQVVVMDEVSAPLNLAEAAELHEVVRRLVRQGRGVLFISHRLPEALKLADRVLVLRESRLVYSGPTSALTADDLAELMLGTTHVAEPAPAPEPPAGQGGTPLLEVTDLRVPGVVHGVDLTVYTGEIIGLTGSRDSGVFEIGGAITGQVTASARTFVVHGEPRSVLTPADASALRFSYFTGERDELGADPSESVARSMMNSGWTTEAGFHAEVAALRKVIAMMASLELQSNSFHKSVGELSGGDAQKVRLAPLIFEDSDLVVLNSPTRGLDVAAQTQLRRLLNDSVLSGSSAVVVSGDAAELRTWCSRVGVIVDGFLTEWIVPETMSPEEFEHRLHAAHTPTAIDQYHDTEPATA